MASTRTCVETIHSASFRPDHDSLLQSARSDVLPATTPSVINDRGATVSFGKNEFVVAAGGSTDVEVRFVAPRNTRADLTRFPLYSGHLTVRGRRDIGRAPEENYNVPYSGLNAKMFDMPGEHFHLCS